jgi:hypothetical protein
MDVLKQKNTQMINNNVLEIIRLFALNGKHRLLGSNSLQAIHYASDYDVVTNITRKSPSTIASQFQTLFKRAHKDSDVWITDFKCGWDERLVYEGDESIESIQRYLMNPLIPRVKRNKILSASDATERRQLIKSLYILRWNREDIHKGKTKLIDGTYKHLKDCIMDKTTMKIDVIIRVGERFIEMSENYYVTYGGETNFDKSLSAKEVIIASLQKQIEEYAVTDKLKSLKRLFSLLRIERNEENEAALYPIAVKLVNFFNSETGFMSKIKNEIAILEVLMEQRFRPIEWSHIYDNLQLIKEEIANVYKVSLWDQIFTIINKMTARKAKHDLIIIKDHLQEKINQNAKQFILHSAPFDKVVKA